MEEVEAGLLEGGIEWLAETVVENLLIDKLDEWVRQVGLGDDTEKLRSEIERVEMVIASVKGRAIGNRALSRSLGRLRELLYDADDAVDELDYYRLHHQVQGVTTVTWHEPEDDDTAGDRTEREGHVPTNNADVHVPPNSSSSKRQRSQAWQHFTPVEYTEGEDPRPIKARCNYCGDGIGCDSKKGTSAMLNHLKKCKKYLGACDQPTNPPSTGDGAPDGNSVAIGNSVRRKRRRTTEESTANTTAANIWNRDDFSNRIQHITRHLQQATKEVLRLHGSESLAGVNLRWITTSNSHILTSSLIQKKMYGRVAQKNSIIKLMTKDSEHGIIVLPIVGIGGIGKTVLSQLVYNDPIVENQFQHRIWVCVSNNFDEVRITREMLDFVSQGKQDGLCSFAKLQEILKSDIGSERFLLVLDDVWDDMVIFRWNKLMAPFKSNNAKGNMVIVTTRSLSVAKRIGTVEPIKLGPLVQKDFWLLFKSCAFGDKNYEAHGRLSNIAQQIADKLKGNPLAAETAGELLSKHHTIDHWNNILKNEDWKSLRLSGGIMPSLKLSYDQLPSHLQRCFLYCSIFPNNHFAGEELVRIWTSQGFFNCSHSTTKLEEIGHEYLTNLVDLGFFEQSTLGDQTWYAICGLMYDFARMVSRTEYATVDCVQCNIMLPSVRHLSILTDSAHLEDTLNDKVEEKLRNAIKPVKHLRTLVLIGKHYSLLSQFIKDIVKKERHLRLLQISATHTDVDPLLCNLVNPTHIRYMKLENGALPQSLRKFYHLQVLDAASKSDLIVPNGVDNFATSLACLQTLHLENCGKWQILSLEGLSVLKKLVLIKMGNAEQVSIPSLEALVLIGMQKLFSCSCTSIMDLNSSLRVLKIERCPVLKVFPLFENCQQLKMERTSWLSYLSKFIIHDCPLLHLQNNLPPSPIFSELSITGIPTLPTLKGSSSSKTLSIGIPHDRFISFDDSCDVLETLDDKVLSFHNLRFITRLAIQGCKNLMSVSFEGLRQLICLKDLEIISCPKLSSFNVPSELTLEDMAVANRYALPSLERLHISSCAITGRWLSVMLQHVQSLHELNLIRCDEVTGLLIGEEENSQANLMSAPEDSSLGYPGDAMAIPAGDRLPHIPLNVISSLKKISIEWCWNLTFYGSFAGFTSLEDLRIVGCSEPLSSLVHKDGRWLLPSSLVELEIGSDDSVETLKPFFPGNHTRLKKLYIFGGNITSLQLYSCTALQELLIGSCNSLSSLEGLQLLNSLRLLHAWRCLGKHGGDGRCLFPQSLEKLSIHRYSHLTLQPCFERNLTCLKKLEVRDTATLNYLDLQSCTALEELKISDCGSLKAIKGLQFLGGLRCLEVSGCLCFPSSSLESLSGQVPKLERLKIGDPSILTTSFCKHLTSLQDLELFKCSEVARLTNEQDSALQLLTSLQKLRFDDYNNLLYLPVGLHNLPSLKRLEIRFCKKIVRLPENGLPPSLEELDIYYCNEQLNDHCRKLASKLKVKIHQFVN